MNTRSFFKSLALLTAGAATCPGIFIPKFEPVVWKVCAAPCRDFEGEFDNMMRGIGPNEDEPSFMEEDWSLVPHHVNELTVNNDHSPAWKRLMRFRYDESKKIFSS